MPAKIDLYFGTALIGEEGKFGIRNHDMKEAQEILDVFFNAGYRTLDSSKFYGEGTTEAYLGKLKLPSDVKIDTKIWPVAPKSHTAESLETGIKDSLQKLGVKQIDVFYLHAPDRSVPYEETVKALDGLHKQGLFKEWGLSNYPAWEVAEIVGIAKANKWVAPTVYEAVYNATTRGIETELIPALRKFGIKLVTYSPLAGGFLTGKLVSMDDKAEKGGRFDPDTPMGQVFRSVYFNEGYVNAVNHMKEACEKNGFTVPEGALRWIQHHSKLQPGDVVILGASRATQLKENIAQSEKGTLPQEVIDAFDAAYAKVGAFENPYFM